MITPSKSDYRMRRICIRYMVRQYRSKPTENTMNNIARFFAQRHHVVYDFSAPIPIPVWK